MQGKSDARDAMRDAGGRGQVIRLVKGNRTGQAQGVVQAAMGEMGRARLCECVCVCVRVFGGARCAQQLPSRTTPSHAGRVGQLRRAMWVLGDAGKLPSHLLRYTASPLYIV